MTNTSLLAAKQLKIEKNLSVQWHPSFFSLQFSDELSNPNSPSPFKERGLGGEVEKISVRRFFIIFYLTASTLCRCITGDPSESLKENKYAS
ncbi:MAG: hypothetical protein HQK65_00835 [Desulfamplus sp.]|nr:hypothetical protein [Desulfamplus sp.]